METENTVSIWIGNFKNVVALESYLDLTYDDDGEIVASDFFKDFNIDINDIDEDLIEKAVLTIETNDIFTILQGASYEEKILDELKSLNKFIVTPGNTVVLVYNYRYDESVKTSPHLNFIATVNYK